MPYTEKQNKTFRAIEHGWTPPNKKNLKGLRGLSRAKAGKMAHEGIKRSTSRSMR